MSSNATYVLQTSASLNVQCTGSAADSANATGNPILIAGRLYGTADVSLTNADMTTLQMSHGRQLVTTEGAGSWATWSYAVPASGIPNATGVTAKAASGTNNVRNYVRSATIACTNTLNANEVTITDGNAGTVLYRFPVGAGSSVAAVIPFVPPLQGSGNTLIEVKLANATTNGIYVNLQGYTAFAP